MWFTYRPDICLGWLNAFGLSTLFMLAKEQDYLARGFDKKDPDFRTDDLILQKAHWAGWCMFVLVRPRKVLQGCTMHALAGFSCVYRNCQQLDMCKRLSSKAADFTCLAWLVAKIQKCDACSGISATWQVGAPASGGSVSSSGTSGRCPKG